MTLTLIENVLLDLVCQGAEVLFDPDFQYENNVGEKINFSELAELVRQAIEKHGGIYKVEWTTDSNSKDITPEYLLGHIYDPSWRLTLEKARAYASEYAEPGDYAQIYKWNGSKTDIVPCVKEIYYPETEEQE